MRKSLHEIQQVENYIFGRMSVQEHQDFYVQLLVNPHLQEAVDVQKASYTLIKAYGRKKLKAELDTVAVGVTASMATALLTAGAKGKRYALPHATIHMHPAGGGAQGYTEDVRIAFREQERIQTQLFHLIGKHTGHSWKEIEEYFNRDRFMNAVEAQTYGFIDEVLGDLDNIIEVENVDFRVRTLAEKKEKY